MEPGYISANTPERNELLSQNENFSNEEREFFQWLCNHYEEKISYNKALDVAYAQFSDAKGMLTLLLSRLRKSGLGILRSEIQDRELTPSYIVLTDKFNAIFSLNLIEELTLESIVTPGRPLPLFSELRKSGYTELAYTLKKIPLQTINDIDQDDFPDQAVMVEVMKNEYLCISTRKFSLLIDGLLLKLRYFFNNSNLVGIIAKKLDTTFSDLQEKIKKTNIRDWQQIANCIITSRSEIFPNISRETSKEIFIYANVLKIYTHRVIKEEAERKEEQEQKLKLVDDLLTSIREHPQNIISKESFSQIIQPFQERLGDDFFTFMEEFTNAHIRPLSATERVEIFSLENGYVHSHKFFSYFYDEFLVLQKRLKKWVEEETFESIHSGVTNHMLLTYSNFITAVQKEIGHKAPFIATILKHPAKLADSILIHAKHVLQISNTKGIERLLGIFFKRETMELKNYDELFELNITKIVTHACNSLPFFKRLYWIFTGKKKQVIQRFETVFKKQDQDLDEDINWINSGNIDRIAETRLVSGKSLRDTRKQDANSTSQESLTDRRKRSSEAKQEAIDRAKQPKQVNKEDMDELWKNFRSAINRD